MNERIKLLQKYEIENLIKQNKDLKQAYKEFRKKYPYEKIVDMWTNCHFTKNIIESTIKYYYNGQVKSYYYYGEI